MRGNGSTWVASMPARWLAPVRPRGPAVTQHEIMSYKAKDALKLLSVLPKSTNHGVMPSSILQAWVMIPLNI